MRVVFNTSPIVFLTKLEYLEPFLTIKADFYIPQAVLSETTAKQDAASRRIQPLVSEGMFQIEACRLLTLVTSLNRRLGIGESEAIALAVELNADYIILDDATARREAARLGSLCVEHLQLCRN